MTTSAPLPLTVGRDKNGLPTYEHRPPFTTFIVNLLAGITEGFNIPAGDNQIAVITMQAGTTLIGVLNGTPPAIPGNTFVATAGEVVIPGPTIWTVQQNDRLDFISKTDSCVSVGLYNKT